MKLKTFFITVAATALMSVNCLAQDINVSLNGNLVNFPNQKPVVVDNRTLIPLRGVFDNMGYAINWNGSTKTVTLTKGSNAIVITIGASVYFLNGSSQSLDVPAQIINGSTMLPLRAIADATGAEVLWDAQTKIATIIDTSSAPNQPMYGKVNISSQQEMEYISSYTELMNHYNNSAMSFINLINKINAQGVTSQSQVTEVYNSAKNMASESISAKNKVAALNCPDKYKTLNNATTSYMQSIADCAQLYMDFIDGKLSDTEFDKKINSIGTDLMLKEAEYRKAFEQAVSANS